MAASLHANQRPVGRRLVSLVAGRLHDMRETGSSVKYNSLTFFTLQACVTPVYVGKQNAIMYAV
jgi:hypothetical protein